MNKIYTILTFCIITFICNQTNAQYAYYYRKDGIRNDIYKNAKKEDRIETNKAVQKGIDRREARKLAYIRAKNSNCINLTPISPLNGLPIRPRGTIISSGINPLTGTRTTNIVIIR
jgi:hypothetical protein